jgi:hypothetical protein
MDDPELVRKVTPKPWLILIFASTSLLKAPQTMEAMKLYTGPSLMMNLLIAEKWFENMKEFSPLVMSLMPDVKRHGNKSSNIRIGSRDEPSWGFRHGYERKARTMLWPIPRRYQKSMD